MRRAAVLTDDAAEASSVSALEVAVAVAVARESWMGARGGMQRPAKDMQSDRAYPRKSREIAALSALSASAHAHDADAEDEAGIS